VVQGIDENAALTREGRVRPGGDVELLAGADPDWAHLFDLDIFDRRRLTAADADRLRGSLDTLSKDYVLGRQHQRALCGDGAVDRETLLAAVAAPGQIEHRQPAARTAAAGHCMRLAVVKLEAAVALHVDVIVRVWRQPADRRVALIVIGDLVASLQAGIAADKDRVEGRIDDTGSGRVEIERAAVGDRGD